MKLNEAIALSAEESLRAAVHRRAIELYFLFLSLSLFFPVFSAGEIAIAPAVIHHLD